MNDIEELLRQELARSVVVARPAPDPLGRLYRRRRRRLFGRGTFAAAAVAVVMLVTGGALATVGDPAPFPAPSKQDDTARRRLPTEAGPVPLTDWTRKLLNGPVRGNRGGDKALVAEVTARLRASMEDHQIDPALRDPTLLYLADVADRRVYAAAFTDGSRGVLLRGEGPLGASADVLVRSGQQGFLEPFVAAQVSTESVAIAPAGCVIASAPEGRVGAGGNLELTWTDRGDFTVVDGGIAGRWWRVTCDGVVRELRHGGAVPDGGVLPDMVPPPLERGRANPGQLTQVMIARLMVPGMPVNGARLVWGGVPPGGTGPVVVSVGPAADGSVRIAAMSGEGGGFSLITAVAGGPLAEPGGPGVGITSSAARSAELFTVRLPADGALSDRLLVVAPAGATSVRAGDVTVALTDGVGVLTTAVPARLSLTALDAAGKTLATASVDEPDADGLLGGHGLHRRW